MIRSLRAGFVATALLIYLVVSSTSASSQIPPVPPLPTETPEIPEVPEVPEVPGLPELPIEGPVELADALVLGVEAPFLAIDVRFAGTAAIVRDGNRQLGSIRTSLKRAAALAEESSDAFDLDGYLTALRDAEKELNALGDSWGSIEEIASASKTRLESVADYASGLPELPEPAYPLSVPAGLSQSVNRSALVNPTLDPILATIDSVTDLQVLATEVVPSLDGLLDQVANTINTVATSGRAMTPPAAGGALATVDGAFITATQVQDTVARQNRVVGELLDSTIEGLGGNVAVPGTGCSDPYIVDGVRVYKGTPNGDDCNGTAGPDLFWTYGGPDTVSAYGNHDQIHLGAGNDTAFGHGGPDYMFGGIRDDNMYGGEGSDAFNDRSKNESGDTDIVVGHRGSDEVNFADCDTSDRFDAGPGEDVQPTPTPAICYTEGASYDRYTFCGAPKVCATMKDDINMGN